MSHAKRKRTIALTALVALVGSVAPLAALTDLCGSDADCPMMSAVEAHCQAEVTVIAGDCCAEMQPAADVSRLAHSSVVRPAPPRLPLGGSIDLASDDRWIGSAVAAPVARGTPLYTLHLALLN